MSRIKFRFSELHKTWKAAKDNAAKIAKKNKDGNAELALKDLYKNQFRSGLGDKLDDLKKASDNVKTAQNATLAKPRDAKLHTKWIDATKKLCSALSDASDVIEDYKSKVEKEKDELGEVYAHLKKVLDSLGESITTSLGDTSSYEGQLRTALTKCTELYKSVELNIAQPRSLTESELVEFLAMNVDPRVTESLPTIEFEP